jgi:acylphosphatase
VALRQVHVEVKGFVHGVGYRSFTVRMARKLGIVGYVKNKEYGTVEVIAEGEEELLNEFVERLREGSFYSYVDGIETQWKDYLGIFDGFHVRW